MPFPFDDDESEFDPGAPTTGADMGPIVGPPLERLPVSMGGMPEPETYSFDIEEVFGQFAGANWASDDPMYHDANLARFMEDGELHRLAQNVIEWVDRDRQSRRGWEQREADGIRKLGMSKADLEAVRTAIPGAEWRSTATHPGLMKACIQFWARSYTELWPPGGPAKAITLGATTPEREQQAARVSGFLNYLYTQEMPGASQETSAMLFRLPLSGSVFRKVYFDPVLGTLRVVFLESQDFVKPYSAVDLGSAPRYTHIVRMTRNDLNRATAMGYYQPITKSEPAEEAREHTPLDYAIDSATGSSPIQGSGENDAEHDNRDILYEMSVTLDLGDYDWEDPFGENWEDPETGDEVSIGVPYLVTVHSEEQRVLSIRRDWRAPDAKKRRRRNVIEYKFLPGFGGYGFGLLHIAGGLSDAQTGFLRYLLDGCTLDTVGKLSGYVSQSAVGMRGLPPLELGKFQPVPGQVDDWRKAIMTPDFQWRAQNVMEAVNYLDKVLETLVASTETMIGDANKEMPVGTVLARIEQASKPFAAIFGLLHTSLAEELRAVADLSADYLPERYPYAVEGADAEVFAADFDERVDVVPVSDPNIVSATQRMTQAQAILEQAQVMVQVMGGSPEAVQAYLAAYLHLLETMRIPNPQRFMPQPQPPMPAAPPPPDPVEAEITRKDAQAIADSDRRDAQVIADSDREDRKLEAQTQREAEAMQRSMAARENGDQALRTAGQNDELAATAQEIMTLAAARQRQMAGNVAPPGTIQ